MNDKEIDAVIAESRADQWVNPATLQAIVTALRARIDVLSHTRTDQRWENSIGGPVWVDPRWAIRTKPPSLPSPNWLQDDGGFAGWSGRRLFTERPLALAELWRLRAQGTTCVLVRVRRVVKPKA